jgi:hypothetical protein
MITVVRGFVSASLLRSTKSACAFSKATFPITGTSRLISVPFSPKYFPTPNFPLLFQCSVEIIGEMQLLPSTQAEYEERVVELSGRIRITVGDSTLGQLSHLITRFCRESAYGLHEQPLIELPDFKRYFHDIK